MTFAAILSISLSYSLILLVLRQQRQKMAKHNTQPKANQVAPLHSKVKDEPERGRSQPALFPDTRRCVFFCAPIRFVCSVKQSRVDNSKTAGCGPHRFEKPASELTPHKCSPSKVDETLYIEINRACDISTMMDSSRVGESTEGSQQVNAHSFLSSSESEKPFKPNRDPNLHQLGKSQDSTEDLRTPRSSQSQHDVTPLIESQDSRNGSFATSLSTHQDPHLSKTPVGIDEYLDPPTLGWEANKSNLNCFIDAGIVHEKSHPKSASPKSQPFSSMSSDTNIERSQVDDLEKKPSTSKPDLTAESIDTNISTACSDGFPTLEQTDCHNIKSPVGLQHSNSRAQKRGPRFKQRNEYDIDEISQSITNTFENNESQGEAVIHFSAPDDITEKHHSSLNVVEDGDDTDRYFINPNKSVDLDVVKDVENTSEKEKLDSDIYSLYKEASKNAANQSIVNENRLDTTETSSSMTYGEPRLRTRTPGSEKNKFYDPVAPADLVLNPDFVAGSHTDLVLSVSNSDHPDGGVPDTDINTLETVTGSGDQDIDTCISSTQASILTEGEKRIEIVELDGTVHLEKVEVVSKGQSSAVPNIEGAVCLMNPKNKELGRRRVELKAALKVGLLFLSFLLLWTPLPLLVTVIRVSTRVPRHAEQADLLAVVSALASVTAALDPILYGLLNRQIYIAMKQMLKKARRNINRIMCGAGI